MTPASVLLEATRGLTPCASLVSDCSAMTTARYRPTWDLALDPLVSCKLCLGEYPVEQMTTIAQCQCIFCTLVGPSGENHYWKEFREEAFAFGFSGTRQISDPALASDRVCHAVAEGILLQISRAPG